MTQQVCNSDHLCTNETCLAHNKNYEEGVKCKVQNISTSCKEPEENCANLNSSARVQKLHSTHWMSVHFQSDLSNQSPFNQIHAQANPEEAHVVFGLKSDNRWDGSR